MKRNVEGVASGRNIEGAIRRCIGIRRTYRILYTQIRKLCGIKIGVDGMMKVLQWFVHIERMENRRIVKRVYEGINRKLCYWSTPKKKEY